jgi:hypothetical protein
MDNYHKYKKYKLKNKQYGGESCSYEFCTLWINKSNEGFEKSDISEINLQKIREFSLLINKYGKRPKIYVDFELVSNLEELEKMDITVINIRNAIQTLYNVEDEFRNNFELQSELFDVSKPKKSINHLIHLMLHPKIPLWTRIDFCKPIVLLHELLNTSLDYCIYTDLDLMDIELYEKFLNKQISFLPEEKHKIMEETKNKIEQEKNKIMEEIKTYYDNKKLNEEKYNLYIKIINECDINNYREKLTFIIMNINTTTINFYINNLINYYENVNQIIKEKKALLNCDIGKVLHLDEKSIFTNHIKSKLEEFGIVAQRGANNSENNFYIVKNSEKIKNLIDNIYIKEVAYFVNILMNYFNNIYNDTLFIRILNKEMNRNNNIKKIIDLYLFLFRTLSSTYKKNIEHKFNWNINDINDIEYLNNLFRFDLNCLNNPNTCEDVQSIIFHWSIKEKDNTPTVYDSSNLICMLTEKSKFFL